MTKQTQKKYTPEYKLEAIALVRDQGFSIGEASAHLDINHNMFADGLKNMKLSLLVITREKPG